MAERIQEVSRFRLGGIYFNTDEPDSEGHEWIGQLSGLASSSTRSADFTRIDGDGDLFEPGRLGSRAINVTGWVAAANVDGLKAARLRLQTAALKIRELGVLEVYDPIPVRARVRREGEILYELGLCTTDRAVARFALTLVAPDPALLALEENTASTSGRWLVNEGNTDSYPVMTIVGTGSHASPKTLTNNGRTVSINYSIQNNDRLVVEFAERRVWLNGVLRPDLIDAASDWWALTPGTNMLTPQQSSVETPPNPTGWSNRANASVQRTTEWAADGIGALVFAQLVAGSDALIQTNGGLGVTAIRPGVQYTAVATMRTLSATTRTGYLVAQTLDAGLGGVGFHVEVVSLAPGEQEFSRQFLAEPTAAWAVVILGVADAAGVVNERFAADAVSLHAGSERYWSPGRANFVTWSTGGTHSLTWRDAYA